MFLHHHILYLYIVQHDEYIPAGQTVNQCFYNVVVKGLQENRSCGPTVRFFITKMLVLIERFHRHNFWSKTITTRATPSFRQATLLLRFLFPKLQKFHERNQIWRCAANKKTCDRTHTTAFPNSTFKNVSRVEQEKEEALKKPTKTALIKTSFPFFNRPAI